MIKQGYIFKVAWWNIIFIRRENNINEKAKKF
jgi:hypothetical protein